MKKRDISGKVYDELTSRIRNFHLLPGVRISDEEVARELGVSRTPVREALNRLAEQGLVKMRPNKGFWVSTFSKKEVEDLYILRDVLERLAVALTIKNLNGKRERKLRANLEKYHKLIRVKNLAGFNDADEEFHDLIAQFSENTALYQTLKNLSGKIRIIRRYDHLRPTSFQETYEEHKQILEQMVAGDSIKARRAMSRHIINSMKTVLRTLPD